MNDKGVILKWLCSESKLRSSNAGLALDVGWLCQCYFANEDEVCGSCSFHTMVASWHLHLKAVQPSFWEVSRLSAAFFWCLVWLMSFCHHYSNSNVVCEILCPLFWPAELV
jgi:hypothetical protein